MDQKKIGSFVTALRKEKGLTQKELAERLFISDKTVSKWETGKGIPDVSLIIPLCELLGITANELLSGERLEDTRYRQRAEEHIIALIKEKQESKRNILLSCIAAVISILPSTALILLSGLLEMTTALRISLIVIAILTMASGIFIAAVLDMKSGTFECRHCKTRFVPTAGAYIAGPHSLTTRYLKCPACGKKSYCKRRLTH
ncbi:MAG: helix-turn-helix transcriptional regulator [Clostridia bacterium]|nr:helix-turn-helix transcriptional regulator [Clostridia bacterium]